MTAPGDISALPPLIRQIQLETEQVERAKLLTQKPWHESGAAFVTINLATDLPYNSPSEAWGVFVLRRTSHVGTRLMLKTGGNCPLGPGDWIRGNLQPGWTLEQNGGASLGTCDLVILKNPQANFHEFEGPDIEHSRQVLLGTLSSAGVIGYVTVPKDTDPTTLLAANGVFDASGYRAIELYIDGGAANTLTSVDLVPWFLPAGATVAYWSQQYDQVKQLADTNPSGGRYRMVAFSLDGAVGLSAWSIRNLLPAPATGLGFMVVGVR